VKDIEVQIANTHIRAPFTGLINQLPVEVGDFASKNTHVATVIDDSRVKISVQVPQQHITKLRKGSTMQAELLNGTTYNGTIDYLSAQANANTRTFTVEASAPLNGAPAFFGQSANIEINVGEELAHKLSPATLDLDTAGNLQVKLLNNDNIVVAHAVEIIRSERDGLWLKGLPAEITVITSGQGFVTPGQQVEVIPSPARVDNSSAANAKPAAQRHSS
jgi:multidrug efflux system membrane fusion protein